MDPSQTHPWLALRLQGWTYRQIGNKFGVSGQAVHQVLTPPPPIRAVVAQRAHERCDVCRVDLGLTGEVHHPSGDDPHHWQDLDQLQYLCRNHHWEAHGLCLPSRQPPKGLLLRLSPALMARLKRASTAHHQSLQAIGIQALEAWLARQEPPPKYQPGES